MRTLGLDVSPLRIGWAVVTDDPGDTECGTITFKKDQWVTPGDRAEAIEDLLVDQSIKGIGLEAVFVGPNKLGSIRAAMALGQVESICDYLWPDARQKVLTASQWRSICGIEQGGKEPVMQWSTDYCANADRPLPDSQDAADAVAIAYAANQWFADNE